MGNEEEASHGCYKGEPNMKIVIGCAMACVALGVGIVGIVLVSAPYMRGIEPSLPKIKKCKKEDRK
jgi:hypothetical protein